MKELIISCTSIGHPSSLHYCNTCHDDEIDGYEPLSDEWFEGMNRKGLHKITIYHCCKFPIENVTRKQVADAIRKVYRS